jgi:hypothetical protein
MILLGSLAKTREKRCCKSIIFRECEKISAEGRGQFSPASIYDTILPKQIQ